MSTELELRPLQRVVRGNTVYWRRKPDRSKSENYLAQLHSFGKLAASASKKKGFAWIRGKDGKWKRVPQAAAAVKRGYRPGKRVIEVSIADVQRAILVMERAGVIKPKDFTLTEEFSVPIELVVEEKVLPAVRTVF